METVIDSPEVAEAVALIDNQLVALRARAIVSAADVSDLLLDLRLLLQPSQHVESGSTPAAT